MKAKDPCLGSGQETKKKGTVVQSIWEASGNQRDYGTKALQEWGVGKSIEMTLDETLVAKQRVKRSKGLALELWEAVRERGDAACTEKVEKTGGLVQTGLGRSKPENCPR